MGGKKQPGRFTIQFNAADPQQRQVIELLNQQGRRKAAFLTSAVLAYCGQGCAPVIPPPSLETTMPELIEQIVEKILAAKEAGTPAHVGGPAPPQPTRPLAPPGISPAPAQAATVEAELPEADLAAICDTIEAFRR